MSRARKTDTIANQVMWNRLIAIVEEQAQALIRTAFSTSVREAGDLSAGVYDANGQMLAQAVTGTPGHVNSMAAAVQHFIRRIGRDNIFTDDIYITNDPWEGTGHLHDLTVVSPVHCNDELVGFFGCTAHVVDIGGRGFGADAASIYEEGLYIPIMKLAERGVVDEAFVHLVRSNVREPDQLVGDMYALASCNSTGQDRLLEMMREYGLQSLDAIAKFILDNSQRATCDRIAALPLGKASGAMTIDGYDQPIRLAVTVQIDSDKVVCDFSGTSGIDLKGINVPLVYTQAYACYALKCAIAPDIPNNAASLAPFIVTAPADCILNAQHPAPVALRHVTGHMIPDVVYDALDKLLPETVPAEGAGTICNFQLSIRPTRDSERSNDSRAEVLTFNSGGSGARPSADGLSATAFPSGVMTMPVEATEQTGPVIIWRKELRIDSGGAGQYRGGLGQHMDVGVAEGYEFHIQAMFDRTNYPARGRHGGFDGAPTTLRRDDGEALRGKGKQFVPAGRSVEMAFPGGAGHGDPAKRCRSAIARDLQLGYITVAAARTDYDLSETELQALLEDNAKAP